MSHFLDATGRNFLTSVLCNFATNKEKVRQRSSLLPAVAWELPNRKRSEPGVRLFSVFLV